MSGVAWFALGVALGPVVWFALIWVAAALLPGGTSKFTVTRTGGEGRP